ncbi:MAG: fumarylacetoacetate hydrolase family protein [Acetobacteraceae bacterium]|nr:fumarylacetoacetate hydrolase family protein [Acetobacteraceae bacterium]
MSGFDPDVAAQAFLDARRTRRWLRALPEAARPRTDADAFAIQDRVAAALGPVGGWKVGAATRESEPFRGPIQGDTIFDDGARLPAGLLHVIGVEGELAYRFERDLPPWERPYATEEVLEAIGSLHPVIEILDTRFETIGSQDALSHRADHQNSGALVVGPALRDWRRIESLRVPIRFLLNGTVRHQGIGGNSAGDNIRLLVWMANVGTRGVGGIRSGQIVTTGSCSGTDWVEPGTEIRAEFEGVGAVGASILRTERME